MRGSRDTWILIFVFLALLVGGYYIASPANDREIEVSTTDNPDPKGVKAFYTLLGERLGYKVARLEQPYTKMPPGVRVLIVVRPYERPIDWGEDAALQDWVRDGGTLIVVARSSSAYLAFLAPGKLGSGRIYVFRNEGVITNKGMRNYHNAGRLLNTIARHAGPDDLILFDDYHHGIGDVAKAGGTAKQVKIALWMLVAAALVLCHARGRRFGAVRRLPTTETVRPGIEFVNAVGRLYQRAHAPGLAAEVLCKSFKQELCKRLGLPSDAANDALVARSAEHSGDEIAARVHRLLADCEQAAAGQTLADSELLRVAREIRSLEKELGLARIDA